MGTGSGQGSPSASQTPQISGIRTVVRYFGIPPSWLDYRPKLPSRNWLIFWSVTTSLAGAYIYDRQECKRIRRSYVDRVKRLAEEPLGSMELPRKVTVYGSKWPGDDDHDRSMRYFRRYVKPVVVAAAVDYEMINGRRHGDLANRISDEIKAWRRVDAGVEAEPQSVMPNLPNAAPLGVKRQRELNGGIVIVGRQTLKEFMEGTRRGWSNGLSKVDREALVANELANDPHFDELDEPSLNDSSDLEGEPIPTPSRLAPSNNRGVFSPLQAYQDPTSSSPASASSVSIPSSLDTPPAVVPPVPPLLLVSFTDHIGFSQIPLMLWDLFNERKKVRAGAEAAYRLIKNHTRPFVGPSPSTQVLDLAEVGSRLGNSDLEFDTEAESYYKRSLSSTPEDIEKARRKYYKELPARLLTARALARGTREPTKDEVKYPPPTEVELRAERLKKELRWRGDLEGWEVVKPESAVAWDERFVGALRVFVDPPEDGTDGLSSRVFS